MYGDPELVKLVKAEEEDRPMQISINANDLKLVNQTYQVFITCHVNVDKTVQDEYFDFI